MKCTECARPVKPVVALDIDGTLAEYHEHFRRFASLYFDAWLPDGWDGAGDWEEYLGLTQGEYREAKLAYRQGGQKRLMPCDPLAKSLIVRLELAGAEVWITTSRPYNRFDSTDPDTREWLRRNSLSFDHLLYDEHKYKVLESLVGVERVVGVLDDLQDQCTEADAVFGKGAALLRYARHNTATRESGGVQNLKSAADILVARAESWNDAHQSS